MAVVTQAHTFVNGEILTATNMNANPANFVSAFANIDSTNIGTDGLTAANLKPATAPNATFGGSVGYTFASPGTGFVPLTVAGIAGQTANIQAWTLTNGGTLAASVHPSGALNVGTTASAALVGEICSAKTATAGAVRFGASAALFDYGFSNVGQFSLDHSLGVTGFVTASTYLQVGTSSGSTTSGDITAARSATTGRVWFGNSNASLDWNVTNGTAFTLSNQLLVVGGISGTGGSFTQNILSASTNTATQGNVTPAYTNAGAALGTTSHIVCGSFAGTGGTVTVTFSGSSGWNGGASYVVIVNSVQGDVPGAVTIINSTSFSVPSTVNGHTYTYAAIGF